MSTPSRMRSALTLLALLCLPFSASAVETPRLVLQITVDGLRADLLERYRQNFSANGFNYLLQNGAVFGNAHQAHANTETIVGHTSLSTGSYPSVHGMTGNVWFDADSGELAYNIEDPRALLLPTREDSGKGDQVDPTQALARSDGRSPRALLVPTFSDALRVYTAGKSKVFGVSGKDRSAVAMAGHTGKAFWMSTDTGDFVTSNYYYDQYPDWVSDWNAERKAEQFGGTTWDLLLEPSAYLLAGQDDRPYEADLRGYGRVFPHRFAAADNKLFFTQILVSPHGDELLADFARTLMVAENLGEDDTPDYLSVSFSSVDAVNHFFGPSSLENEDVVLRLDRTLAGLLTFVDDRIGLEHTLIVLSADHGMAEMPEYMTELGYEAGRISNDEITDIVNRVGRETFRVDDLAAFFFRPYLYLDEAKIRDAGLDIASVELAVARAVAAHPGIDVAVPRSGLSSLEQTRTLQLVKNNSHPQRSGHIYVVQKPYWFMFESGPIAVMHGSPWQYDSHVPLVFVGRNIDAGHSERYVETIDAAPTLSRLLGMSPPAGSHGEPLHEVFGDIESH